MSCHEEYLQNKQEPATRVITCIVWSMDPICWAMKPQHRHAAIVQPWHCCWIIATLTNKTFVDVAVVGFDWLCWSFEAEPTMIMFAWSPVSLSHGDPSPGSPGWGPHTALGTSQTKWNCRKLQFHLDISKGWCDSRSCNTILTNDTGRIPSVSIWNETGWLASEVSTNDLLTSPCSSSLCVGGDIIPILLGAILIVHGPGNEADTIVNTALAVSSHVTLSHPACAGSPVRPQFGRC